MLLPLEEIEKINDYPKEKWADLLALIPIIETLNKEKLDLKPDFKFNENRYGEIADEFHKIVYEMGIMIIFAWTQCEEGKKLLRNKQANYHSLSLIKLCQMITMFVRADRFNGGLIISLLADGTILKILKEIEIRVTEESN